MRPGKPRPRVTADLCGKIKILSCSKALDLSILKNYTGSLIYRPRSFFYNLHLYTERNYPKAIKFYGKKGVTFFCRILNVGAYFYVEK
jgi:hypothetical protein